MHVLIFEDNQIEHDHLVELLNNYGVKSGLSITIETTCNPEHVLEHHLEYDLLFLDIEVHEHSGIELGMKIRSNNKDCIIVLCSSFSKYLVDGYKVQAQRYMLKPIDVLVFETEMDSLLKNVLKDNKSFFDPKISNHKIFYKDIHYIEFINRKSIIYLNNHEIYETIYPLKYWLEQVESLDFVQCHRSFVINMNYIASYKKDIQLTSNTILPISRHYKEPFITTYHQFLHGCM